MSTKEPHLQVFKHSVKGDSLKITTARKSTAKLPQALSLPKLGITKSEGDSGIGSSDSSDSMSDVKDSFQEAIMNLKALNGEGDSAKAESGLESESVKEKSGNCNGKSILKTKADIDDQSNGDAKSVASPGVDSKPSDNGHETPSIESVNDSEDVKEQEPMEVVDEVTELCEEASEDQCDEPSQVQSEEPLETQSEELPEAQSKDSLEAQSEGQYEIQSEEPSEVQSEEPSEVQSEVPSEVQSEEPSELQSEEPSEVQSELQSDVQSEMQSGAPSEIHSEETSQDADREISAEPEVSTSDKIEIVDSDNEETNETVKTLNSCDDDEVMLLPEREPVTEKDEKSQDSELGDHPLTIGDKVRNSVRDIMSKLKQGNELNKLLVKPKHEECMDVEPTSGLSEKTSEKSKLLSPSPRKGNLFENLTVIGAGSASSKTDGISAKDGRSVTKITSELSGSQESDVEFIDDDFDKKDDDIILCDDEEPIVKSNSGNPKVQPQGTDTIKSESASKEPIIAETKTEFISENKPVEQEVKKEVKSECKVEREDDIKPMEIEENKDSEVKEKVEKVTQEESAEAAPASRTDRKRSQEDPASESGAPPKRSRLDMVIGKLGSQIGISPDTIKSDTSDEDSHPGSEMSEKSEDALSSVSDEDDDKTSQSSTKTIRLSGKELEALVRSKVSTYLKAHRDSKMDSLKTKMVELQLANESWKAQARELQRKVLELTVLQQRLEKRKAATAALRQITTRSVAVQADDTKTNFATGLAVKQPKTPPKAAAPATSTSFSMPIFSSNTASAPVSSTSVTGVVLTSGSKISPATAVTGTTVNRSSVSQLLSATAVLPTTPSTNLLVGQPPLGNLSGVRPQLAHHLNTSLSSALPTSLTTVRSLLDNTKTIDTTSKLQTVSGQPISGSNVIVVSSPNLAGQVAAKGIVNVPKVIDLTSDDDNAKGPATGSQPARTMTVMPGTAVSALRPGLVQQQVIRGVNPLTLQQSLTSGTSILLSSPGLVNAGAPSLTRPGGTFQIVTVASGSNLRPGTLLTVVPASSHVNTQQTQIRTTVPTVLPVAKPAGTPVGQTMPQLRPGTTLSQITVSTPVRPATSLQTVTARPPPPLQTAPSSTPVSTPISLAPAQTAAPAPASSPAATPKHPAPLPAKPANQLSRGIKGSMPPKPGLKISRVSQGIVLSWNMTLQENHAEIASYQLFAYQESSAPPSTSLWKKVGDVKALPLPMACTLTQFQEGNKYHFAVRAVDNHNRLGDFSDPSTIHLTPK